MQEKSWSAICHVASYNIHQCIGGDRRFDVPRVARVIRGLEADIIGLQEVNAPFGKNGESMQLDFLSEATGLRAVGAPTIQRHNGYYGNALLTKWRIMEVRRFDLTYLHRESRGALDVELEIKEKLLRVIVTHLGLLPAERRFQVKQLLQIVGDFPVLPVIVLGDLNEWFLLGRPARWLHRYFGRAPTPRTFPAFFPVFSLDRILARPRASLLDIRAFNTADSRRASDHLPIKGLIGIP